MKQILHIFAKDARHQWLEILISLAVTVALVFTGHSRWHGEVMLYGGAVSFSPYGLLSSAPGLLAVIVPLSWWLLISPAIHEEKLVGDRQFWITRPYEWKKLLAAKLLFLVVFLYVPLLLAQCVMLALAGFSPLPHLRGLLYDLLLLTCIVVLPLVVLATVTKNFARMTLAALGAVAYVVAILMWGIPPDRVATPYAGEIAFSASVCLCVAVVIVQFARRPIKVSWILLALLMVVLFGAFTMASGTPDNSEMDRTYPPSQPAAAVAQFTYQDKPESQPTAFVTGRHDRVGISIPVLASRVADGTVATTDFARVTLQAPGGAHWTSVWQADYGERFSPGERLATVRFTMPRTVYDAFKGKPLHVQVDIALTQARAGNEERFFLGQGDFAVPGVGICTPVTGLAERPDEIAGLDCRAPLRQPELTFVRTAWHTGPCSSTSPNSDHSVQTAAWIGAIEREPADFGIVPVWSSGVGLSNQVGIGSNSTNMGRHLCPQTPVTFTRYALTARGRTAFTIDGFQLPLLNAGQNQVINRD